jgi:hypothetical protein
MPASGNQGNRHDRGAKEAARALPDLLKARREAMEARWRGEAAARHM